MAFTRAHFIRSRHRPWLYHFTTPQNVELLRRERAMLSAAAWVARANEHQPNQIPDPHAFLGTARLAPHPLVAGPGLSVTLNDQWPLRSEEFFFALQGTYPDFIRHLNGLVFFWPGNDMGATPRGDLAETFEARYQAFGCLRVPTADLWGADTPIRFCRYNSGAPQRRDRITRGPHIFVPCTDPDLMTADVAEVVFPGRVALPASTRWRPPGETEWDLLFEPAAVMSQG
jgi:hypothetical protein